MMKCLATAALFCSAVCLDSVHDCPGQEASSAHGQHWPQWRGPHGDGIAPHANPPVTWSETNSVRWKVPIRGRGHSTPIVWANRIFLVIAIPLEQKLPTFYKIPDGTPRIRKHSAVIKGWKAQALVLQCLDRTTGETSWQRTVREVMPHQGYHWKGSFASASPVTDGEHVYISFGSFGLYCYDTRGEQVWKKDLGAQAMEDGLGEGSSPALKDNTLIVVVDHELQSFVVAIDKRSGDEIWRRNREEVSNWTTPRIFEYQGRHQVVVNGETVRSYDLNTGELLWQSGGQSEGAIPIPAVGRDMVFATSGYAEDTLHAIRLGRHGDLSGSTDIVWSLDRGTPYVPCPLLWGDELYLLEDRSFFSCLRASDGKRHYFKSRLPRVKNFSASPVGAADRIYLLSEEGRTVVLQRGTEPKVVATNDLQDNFFASPAIVGNEIFLRGEQHLYCVADSTTQD